MIYPFKNSSEVLHNKKLIKQITLCRASQKVILLRMHSLAASTSLKWASSFLHGRDLSTISSMSFKIWHSVLPEKYKQTNKKHVITKKKLTRAVHCQIFHVKNLFMEVQ